MSIYRINLIEKLKNYNPTQIEENAVSDLLSHIQKNDDCFERNHIEGAQHIAASVFLINENNEILFLWHKKIQQWTQPGGHCDGNENTLEVATIELEEETGITNPQISSNPLEIRKYEYDKSVFGYTKCIYNICYLAKINSKTQSISIREPEKCEKIRWMSVDEAISELIKSTYPHPIHMIEKFKARMVLEDF